MNRPDQIEGMRIFCSHNFDFRGLSVWVHHEDPVTGKIHTAQPLVMEPHDPGTMRGNPTFTVAEEQMQHVMNALWKAGVRPHKNEIGHTQVDDIQAHLQDMRAIAFDKMKVPKPGE